METAILVLIATVLGGGILGALVIAVGWELRTLRLKRRVDAIEEAVEALNGRHLAAVKRAAGKEGLEQRARNKEIEELARTLPAQNKVQESAKPWWEEVGNTRG